MKRSREGLKTQSLIRASKIIGEKVINAEQENLGKIEDVVLDVHGGRIAYAVLSFGGFLGMGDKLFALPWKSLQWDAEEECFLLNVARERLENAPGFAKDNWPDFASDRFGVELSEYYGQEAYR